MSEVLFRRARQDDLPAIVALLADDALGAARENASLPLDAAYVDAFNAIARDPNQLAVIVEDREVVAGYMQLSFIPGLSRRGMWRGQIESVRIASDRRGAGLGQQMFEWGIAQCRARGCGLVQLTTDRSRPDALRFYEKLGFVASHDGLKLSLT